MKDSNSSEPKEKSVQKSIGNSPETSTLQEDAERIGEASRKALQEHLDRKKQGLPVMET